MLGLSAGLSGRLLWNCLLRGLCLVLAQSVGAKRRFGEEIVVLHSSRLLL